MDGTGGTTNGVTNGTGLYASRLQLAELDRQIERGSLFTQATLQRGFRRIGDAEELLLNVVRALTAKGLVTEDELGVVLADEVHDVGNVPSPLLATAGQPEEEEEEEEEEEDGPATPAINWPTIALRVDSPDADDPPTMLVDCNARMPVCRAVCCKLKFPLSTDEVDSGKVKWDIGHPYIIRQESTGSCTHNNAATGHCGVYDDRPAICRRYTCAGDTRIWKDFDAMVLNEEWIEGHLGRRDLHLAAVLPSMEETG